MKKGLLFTLLAVLWTLIGVACGPGGSPGTGETPSASPSPSLLPETAVQSIEVSGYKDTFRVGEAFTTGDGFTVRGEFEDGTERALEETEYEVDSSSFDPERPGEATITVSAASGAASADYSVLVNDKIRILSIGNSFSEDAQQYLYKLIDKLGYYDEVIMGSLVIGGCSLDKHYTNARDNKPAYAYRKETELGVTSASKKTILDALEEEDWDYVTIQQVSQDSGRPQTIPHNQIASLTEYIRTNASNPFVKVAWHATWAYQANSTHGGFANYGRDQTTMYHAIVDVAKDTIQASGLFDRIIPNMTAVQNARTSYVGDTLTRDGFHMSFDRGRFLVGLMFYKALSGDDITPLVGENMYGVVGSYVNRVDAAFVEMAVECVDNAYRQPFEVTRSRY